jgi:hypothetical protein
MVDSKKLSIIVPYSKNRIEDLYTFVGHMEYFLKDKVDYEIHFIEQLDPDIYFNYGKLCNIGAAITSKNSDYYIFHDIDILPKQETCNYEYEYYPTHLCPNLKPYPHWIGGAFKIKKEDFYKINGFSNDYWGGVFHWIDLLFRMNKYDILPNKRFFTKDIYKPHNLLDIIEVNKFIKKKIYPLESNENNCCFIKANKTTDYLFEDSFTISMNVFINDNQSSTGCIIGKQGYDMGIFIMKNEAIAVQIWGDDGTLYNIWQPVKNYSNQWINLTLKVNLDKRKMGLYIDGKLTKQEDCPTMLMDFRDKDLWIGSLAFKDCFNGKISNLLCFDYALNDSEIFKLYQDGYKNLEGTINTNFESIIDIPFNKKFGDFYVDESKSHANARLISTGLHQNIFSEELELSFEFNMPEQSNGSYEILENSNKFRNLENYQWDEKDESFIENENIFFYEIATKVLNTEKFGLNTLSYDLVKTEEMKKNIYKHTIKI